MYSIPAFLPYHAAWIPAVNHSRAIHLPSGGPTLNICTKSEVLRNSAQMITLFYSISKQINLFYFIIISYCQSLFFFWLEVVISWCSPNRAAFASQWGWAVAAGWRLGCVLRLRSVWLWYLWWFNITSHCGGNGFLGVRCLCMQLYLFQPLQKRYGDFLFKLG